MLFMQCLLSSTYVPGSVLDAGRGRSWELTDLTTPLTELLPQGDRQKANNL